MCSVYASIAAELAPHADRYFALATQLDEHYMLATMTMPEKARLGVVSLRGEEEFTELVTHMHLAGEVYQTKSLALSEHWQSCKRCQTGPKEPRVYRYLITFTLDPAKTAPPSFEGIIQSQLDRKPMATAIYAIEHVETNMHAHAYVTSTRGYTPQDFDSYRKRYGFVDVKLVKSDNGVAAYLGKENQVYEKNLSFEGITTWVKAKPTNPSPADPNDPALHGTTRELKRQ